MLREALRSDSADPYHCAPRNFNFAYGLPTQSYGNGTSCEIGAKRTIHERNGGVGLAPSMYNGNGYGNLENDAHEAMPQFQQEGRFLTSFGYKENASIVNQNLHAQDHLQMAKNVHFSPVVSKLRYTPAVDNQQYRNVASIPKCIRECDIKSPFYFETESAQGPDTEDNRLYSGVIHKVKVHVQQFDKPVQVQKIQVGVPQCNGLGTERFAVNLAETPPYPHYPPTTANGSEYGSNYYRNRNSEPISLFAHKFFADDDNPLIDYTHADQHTPPPHLQQLSRNLLWEEDSVLPPPESDAILPLKSGNTSTTSNGRLFSAFGVTSVSSPSYSSCGCRHEEACDCIMRAPAEQICDMNTPAKINACASTPIPSQTAIPADAVYFTPSWRPAGDSSNGESESFSVQGVLNTPQVIPLTRNINNVGSLELLEPDLEEKEVVCQISGDDVVGGDSNKKGGKNHKKDESKVHSWPNAYRKLKEKSKPKLSFLHRLTFGRFGGGGNSETKADNKSKSSKKAQKRSSCPPLGHPLLEFSLNGGSGTESGESNGGNDTQFINDLNNTLIQGKLTDSFGVGGGSDKQLKRDAGQDLQKSELSKNVSSDLPPKPSPRQKKHNLQPQPKNSSARAGVPSDPDEFSIKFEQILEGILDLECDDSIPIMEEKEIGPWNLIDSVEGDVSGMTSPHKYTRLTRIDESDNDNHNLCNAIQGRIPLLEMDTDDDKTSNSTVVGKPPKPPISARQIGMRSGASERFSYLRGRMAATAATETRLAMELAAKLCEFREELHRSREEIAKSHPNLEEIENSVRISLAIDRAQRTLPQSRNSTGVSHTLPTATTASITTTSSSGSSSSSPTTKELQPVKPVTERIKEEWESVVLRAKESLRPSHNHQQRLRVQVPSNNGKSGDPCHSRATVLETDLDTGASRGFPLGNNSFNYGDTARHTELGKVLIFEDFTPPSSLVPKNSCSLQNLSSFGVTSDMATLKPGDPGGGGGGTNGGKEDRSRSMEFLMEDSNKNAHLRPPENTLMKNQETRRMSEHELRIQRSLQKLNVPDWYKNYAPSGTVSAAGTPSKSRDFGSGSGLAGGWPGLSTSKTNSLTSLQSAGRYAGSKAQFGYGRHRSTGTASTGGRSSRESLMSPSSTASASPSPNFERSSFTYGMPYALTRFAAARMSCGASPASLSPSPSPVGGIGSSTSTPVSSGPTARYGYQKTPYLGWRSQERLNQKSLYRSPAERLAADLIAQKVKPPAPVVVEQPPPPQIEINEKTSPKKETASSDLSLNNSEESNSHKLNRVRSSIKEVSNAIVDYVNETKPLDDGINGRASPRRGFVWLESSFVGTKPLDSPGTPDTPSTFMSQRGSRKDTTFRFDDTPSDRNKDSDVKSGESSSTSHYTSYLARNEQMEERSNSSSVSSPTLEDVLDSLLALRRPNKKFRSRGKGHDSTTKVGGDNVGAELVSTQASTPTPSTTSSRTPTTAYPFDEPVRAQAHKTSTPTSSSTYHQYQYEPSTTSEIYSTPSRSINKYSYQSQSPSSASTSDWQERMNQPLVDSAFISGEPETYTLTGSRTSGTIGASGTASTPIISSGSYNSSSNINNNASSNERPQMSRYSSASASTPTMTSGVNESVVGYSSSSYVTQSPSSSVHSTPTHQPYQYKHNQSSSSPSSAVASSKDYYYSSASSSPAKSCLVDSTQRDDNELRQSLLRGGALAGVGGDDEEELAFGNPTEICSTVTSSTVAPITGGVIVNPLTGLSEYSNPPTPARHRRVSFDLDFSDKEEKSSSRSRNKDETVGGTIQCRNTKCGKTATGLEARREFKVCHNCNAYYCSRECRRAHWEKHKKTCMQSRVGAICKQIISHVKEDSYVMNQLSTVAKRGFLAKGRGSVKLFFNSPDRAERFLTGGLPELPEPLYIPHSDMLPEEMGAQTFSELSEQCRSYNPDTRFVLYACVCVVNEVPTYGAVKWERELISRSSKLRLLLPRNFYEENQRHHHAPATAAHLMPALQDTANGRILNSTSPSSGLQPQPPTVSLYDIVAPSSTTGEDLPPPPPPHQSTTIPSESTTTTSSLESETLILRSVPPPSSHQLSQSEHKRLREVSFTNIQKHLLLRGVDLKRSYPDIFMKLCKYVELDEPFLPVTIYPKNNQTGRQFVCIIMPESSDSAYSAATEESGQRHSSQRVETINILELDDDEFLDIT